MESIRQRSTTLLHVHGQYRLHLWVLLLLAGAACVLTATVVTRISPIQQWSPTRPAELESDWLFQSSFSDLEIHDGEPARWLVTQPKRSDLLINRAINDSLARLATAISPPGYAAYSIRLFTPEPKQLTITGNGRVVTYAIAPGIRTYTTIVEQDFVPTQTRLYAISTQRFEPYGFGTDKPTQSARDARLLIADFRGAQFSVWPTITHATILWLLAFIPLLWLIAVAVSTPRRLDILLCGVIVYVPWLQSVWMHTPASYEPLVTVIVTTALVFSRRVAVFWGIVTQTKTTPLWMYVLVSSIFVETRALPASQWMIGVDFARLPNWGAFFAFLLEMRAAFPIPLLTIEYALARIPTWWVYDVGYSLVLMRWAAVASLLAALSGIHMRGLYGTTAKHFVQIVLALGIAFIYRYDDRNYWMAYDACIGLALVVVFRLLRSPLDRPRLWLGLACAIVVADSLRPYMQLFVPALVGVAAFRIWRIAGIRGIGLFCIPLVYPLVWHGYHIFVLEQWSWSNYSGFNIARAWLPDAYAAAVRGLPPDMQHPLWGERSNALTREVLNWISAYPNLALERAFELLWQMVKIPVEFSRFNDAGGTYEVTRVLPWYIVPFRLTVVALLVIQLTTMVLLLRHRREGWWVQAVERVIWITIFCLTALSETGEQARFVASFIPIMLLGVTEFFKIIDWNTFFRRYTSRICATNTPPAQ